MKKKLIAERAEHNIILLRDILFTVDGIYHHVCNMVCILTKYLYSINTTHSRLKFKNFTCGDQRRYFSSTL